MWQTSNVTCSAIFLAVLLIFCYKEEDLNQLLKSLKGLKGK